MATATGAAAADGFTSSKMRAPEVHTWTGVYLGLGVGAAMISPEISTSASRQGDIGLCNPADCGSTFIPLAGPIQRGSANAQGLGDFGGFGTVQNGYDVQAGSNVVAGLCWRQARFPTSQSTLIHGLAAYTRMRIKGDVNFTAGDPLGFIAAINAATNISSRFSDSLHGYTVGGGIETKLSRNWSAKLEYPHTHFEDASTASSRTRIQC